MFWGEIVQNFGFFPPTDCMSICPILSPLKWSDQGCVSDLPQVSEPGNCQSSEDAVQHWHG